MVKKLLFHLSRASIVSITSSTFTFLYHLPFIHTFCPISILNYCSSSFLSSIFEKFVQFIMINNSSSFNCALICAIKYLQRDSVTVKKKTHWHLCLLYALCIHGSTHISAAFGFSSSSPCNKHATCHTNDHHVCYVVMFQNVGPAVKKTHFLSFLLKSQKYI